MQTLSTMESPEGLFLLHFPISTNIFDYTVKDSTLKKSDVVPYGLTGQDFCDLVVSSEIAEGHRPRADSFGDRINQIVTEWRIKWLSTKTAANEKRFKQELCDAGINKKSKNIFFRGDKYDKENVKDKNDENENSKSKDTKMTKNESSTVILLDTNNENKFESFQSQEYNDRLGLPSKDEAGVCNDNDFETGNTDYAVTAEPVKDEKIFCDIDCNKKCSKKKKRKEKLSISQDPLRTPPICFDCDNIISLKDLFAEFEGSLTQEARDKFLEVKLALIEYEKTYNQEFRVLLLLARQAVSWKFYLPLFNRRCMSRNIQKLKVHSDSLEQCLDTKNSGNFLELLEVLDTHMEDKYLSLLTIYCENMGELRLMFGNQMRKDSDFWKLLFSVYFQMERTLLPIHHLTYIQSLIVDVIEIFPNDLSDALYNKVISFDNKLSKMLTKCYEVTTSIYGVKFLRKIENLFPLDLKLSSSVDQLDIDDDVDISSLSVVENINSKQSSIVDDNIEVMFKKEKMEKNDSIIRHRILNKNVEVDLLDLSDWIKRISFDVSEFCDNETFISNDDVLNVCEVTKGFDEDNIENDSEDIIEFLNSNSGKLEISKDSNCGYHSNVKVKSKVDANASKSHFYCALPLCYTNDYNYSCSNNCKKNSKTNNVNESFEMTDLSLVSHQARLRLKKQYSKSSSLPHYSVLNTSFDEEPIYQIYAESSLQSDVDFISDGEDDIKKAPSAVFYIEPEEDCISEKISSDQKNSVSQDESSYQITRFPPCNIQRTLWRDTERVISQGIIDNMSKEDLALQESKYEVLTSEVSYLKSLTILVAVFIESPELNEILSTEDKEDLFKYVLRVKETSEMFLYDLAGHWDEDILMKNVYNVIEKHVKMTFSVYVDYCSNQLNLHRTLQRLLIQDDNFVEVTRELERSPECLGYSLDSFLSLPMQRVTRLPLLLHAIQRRLLPDSDEFKQCNGTLNAVCELAQECNEAVRRMEEKCDHLQMKKKLSLDNPKVVGLSAKFSKIEKSSGLRRWSLFSTREVKIKG